MTKASVFIIFLLLVSSTVSMGQCCSAGNPAGGDGSNDGLNKKELRIFTSYKHSLSEQYFYHDSKTDLHYIERSYYDYQNLSITYGILPRLSVHTELGFFYNKTQDVNINGDKDQISSHGLGDLTLNVRYIPVRTVKPLSQLVLAAGVKFPVGAFNEEINGITIPVSLQPSSGALKYNASAFYFRKRGNLKFGWNSFAFFEISQTINKGFLVYRYGNYFQFALAGTYAITKDFNFIANAKFEWRGKDKRESGIKIESTGSYVIFFNPQLIYNFKYRWGVVLMADVPVYKYVNGYQLTNRFSIQVGLRKSFLFCKKEKVQLNQ
jgi:hypothetical protein